MFRFKGGCQFGVIRKGQPILTNRFFSATARTWPHLIRPISSGLGNGPIAFAHAHPMNHLTIMKHLESPVGHGSSSRNCSPESLPDFGYRVRDAFGSFQIPTDQSGSISAITKWPHFGDHKLAPFRRSPTGPISAIRRWLHFGDHGLALYHRSITRSPPMRYFMLQASTSRFSGGGAADCSLQSIVRPPIRTIPHRSYLSAPFSIVADAHAPNAEPERNLTRSPFSKPKQYVLALKTSPLMTNVSSLAEASMM